jgi:hypothetical protein
MPSLKTLRLLTALLALCSSAVVTAARCPTAFASAGSGPASRQWLAPDFFVEPAGGPEGAKSDSLLRLPQARKRHRDCRKQIADALCLITARPNVAPFSPQSQPYLDMQSRSCDPNNGRYVAFFEAVYDRFTPVMQQMFCSLGTLVVDPHLESIAYAGMRGSSAVMGFRRSAIDENLSLDTLLTWKEQLPFGGDPDSYDLSSDLPMLQFTAPPQPAHNVAYYVLAHEFAHLFDFANGINKRCFPGEQCPVAPESFAGHSWETSQRPLGTQDFVHREEICYYHCQAEPLPARAIGPLYAGLHRSNFITLYAATNVFDDFAESVAFYLLDQLGDATFRLDTRQGQQYDLLGGVGSTRFAGKKQFIETFLADKAVRYP